MTQPPSHKRIPKGIEDKSDGEVAEAVFGKRIKQELDRIAGIDSPPMKPD